MQVTDGLEVADDEAAAYSVLSRAIASAAPDHATELLLADSSNAHLTVGKCAIVLSKKLYIYIYMLQLSINLFIEK